MTRVACLQLAPRIADLAANRELTLGAIRAAVEDGADVVVLPELATSGYVFASREEAASVAIPADHELLREWAAAAGRAVVVGGFCERGADGTLYNSAALLDGGEVRAVYRKLHLWDAEKLVFTAGDAAPPVLDTSAGRIGMLVCYDLEFPELTRGLALAGAELVAVPTNWPRVPCPPGEHGPEVIAAMAAARANRMFIACADRTGTERGQEWMAATAIVGADGWIVAEAGEGDGATATADVDLAQARDKRVSEHGDALGDRRPELSAP
jgi:predicted amidohydrolase